MQSKRLIIPEIKPIVTMKEIAFGAKKRKFFADEEIKNNFQNYQKMIKYAQLETEIIVLVGPEGGIDRQEASFLTNSGYLPISLGKRILRCETAPLLILSSLIYHTEIMKGK